MSGTFPNCFNRILAMAVISGLVFIGCAMRPPQPPSSEQMEQLDRMQPRELLARAKHTRKPGPPPFSEQAAPLAKEIVQPPVLYSLVFDKAPLGDVIAALTKDSEYNLSVESEIDLAREVTVSLKNVMFNEALDMIVVNGSGYAWTIENGTLFIKRFKERIYRLDFLDMVGETDIDPWGSTLLPSGSIIQESAFLVCQFSAHDSPILIDDGSAVKEMISGVEEE